MCIISCCTSHTVSYLGTPGSRKLSKTISNAFEQTDLAKAKENIQKELFTHERLVSCITVTKTKDSKKKKPLAFLCVTGRHV